MTVIQSASALMRVDRSRSTVYQVVSDGDVFDAWRNAQLPTWCGHAVPPPTRVVNVVPEGRLRLHVRCKDCGHITRLEVNGVTLTAMVPNRTSRLGVLVPETAWIDLTAKEPPLLNVKLVQGGRCVTLTAAAVARLRALENPDRIAGLWPHWKLSLNEFVDAVALVDPASADGAN